jgi:SAM-dependent methyltransferase
MADERTLEAYGKQAGELAACYRGIQPAFLSRVVALTGGKGRLLDIGCGSGRDMAAFMEEGFEVMGVEPVAAFREEAIRSYPQLNGKILQGALPDSLPRELGTFDVVHVSAVLMHLQREELFNAVFTIRELLKPRGWAHLSFCPDRTAVDEQNRDSIGRLFSPIDETGFEAVLRRAGFAIESKQEGDDGIGRPIRWVSLIVRKVEASRERPLLRIERIINHDTKDATYKLALLRALAELARSHFHAVTWMEEGQVALPVSFVVEKWIQYYWPLLEHPSFIAQKNGEEHGCAKPMMFRSVMEELMAPFRGAGSYSAYLDVKEADPAVDRNARSKIRDAIRNGPVKFASGGVFGWAKVGGQPCITMAAGFWEELAEMTYWIEPTIRLRWAEESHRFSKATVDVGTVLDLLTRDLVAERNVRLSRDVFAGLNRERSLAFTWSSAPLRAGFDIDHIIPYVMWHNNDLWNLVPAHPRVNNSKRDKLVVRDKLLERRDFVIEAWKVQRERLAQRFDRDLSNLLERPPNPRNWELPAFNRLAEAIEATALRRQSARWQG